MRRMRRMASGRPNFLNVRWNGKWFVSLSERRKKVAMGPMGPRRRICPLLAASEAPILSKSGAGVLGVAKELS